MHLSTINLLRPEEERAVIYYERSTSYKAAK